MICKCNIIEITGEIFSKHLGRVWDLGPVLVSKEPGSNSLSIIGTHETFENSFVTLQEFKQVVMTEGIDKPFTVKFSLTGERGPYGLDPVQFTDSIACRYKRTVYEGSKIILMLEMLAKGKELSIFNGNEYNGERTGGQKPLFWASILKGNIH